LAIKEGKEFCRVKWVGEACTAPYGSWFDNFMKIGVYQEFWKQWDAQEQAEAAARFVRQEQMSLRSSKKKNGMEVRTMQSCKGVVL
jgi:hypothetical protein